MQERWWPPVHKLLLMVECMHSMQWMHPSLWNDEKKNGMNRREKSNPKRNIRFSGCIYVVKAKKHSTRWPLFSIRSFVRCALCKCSTVAHLHNSSFVQLCFELRTFISVWNSKRSEIFKLRNVDYYGIRTMSITWKFVIVPRTHTHTDTQEIDRSKLKISIIASS